MLMLSRYNVYHVHHHHLESVLTFAKLATQHTAEADGNVRLQAFSIWTN